MSAKNRAPGKKTTDAEQVLWVRDNRKKVIDRNGRPVTITGDVWSLQDPSDNIRINWNTLKTPIAIKEAAKSYVAHTIESQAPQTANQVFEQLRYCFKRMPAFDQISELTYEVIEAAIAKARVDHKEWHFHYVRRWYQWCEDRGIPGFTVEIAVQLSRLKIAGNSHGIRVMSRDINDGPLSHDEHFLIRQALRETKGRPTDRVIMMLLMETGARPVQLVQLEEHDLILNSTASEHPFYSLNIPRAKQRQIGEPEKKRRRISPELGRSIEELIKQNHKTHGDHGLSMPILCTTARDLKRKKLTKELATKYKFHLKVVGFTSRVRRYPAQVGIISPRTQKVLKLHALRLRYTFFTMLAEQGAATNHLAELADHLNERSILIYVSSTSSVVARLNAALGKDPHYSSTIARFLGQLVSSNDPHAKASIIVASTPTLKDLGGIGSCGAKSLCNLYPPLSCYVCPKFQAWIDAPHEALLKELEEFVQSLINTSANQADRIPYQLVDVITSLRQLVAKVEDLKNHQTTQGRN